VCCRIRLIQILSGQCRKGEDEKRKENVCFHSFFFFFVLQVGNFSCSTIIRIINNKYGKCKKRTRIYYVLRTKYPKRERIYIYLFVFYILSSGAGLFASMATASTASSSASFAGSSVALFYKNCEQNKQQNLIFVRVCLPCIWPCATAKRLSDTRNCSTYQP
jgi:hypothetical protein